MKFTCSKRCTVVLAALALNFSANAESVPHDFDFLQIKRGGILFQQYCAVCHGKQAEGAPNWLRPGSDGKYPPPPLNGSAHAWHHPTKALMSVIKNGTQRIGGNMPPWKEKLSDEQIKDIIAWFQAKWPDEIYAVWYRNDQRAGNR